MMLGLDNGQYSVLFVGSILFSFGLIGLMNAISRYRAQLRQRRRVRIDDAVDSGEYFLQRRVPYKLDEDGNVIENE
jgi:hypothetical protein